MEIIYATPFQPVIAMMWVVISCLMGRRSHQGLAIMVRNSSDIVPEALFLGRAFPSYLPFFRMTGI